MEAMKDFLRATVVGGLLFLLPLTLVLFFLVFAVQGVIGAVQPFLTSHGLSVLGGAGIGLLALAVLVLMAFAAGMFARTERGARVTNWLEHTLLGGVPQYQVVKGMAQGLAHVETTSGLKPSLISIDGGWQIGYVIEKLENGWVTVFLPQAPKATQGCIMYVAAERVRPLTMTIGQAMGIATSFGVGSAEALRGAELTQPKSP